jgi:hypothetical protein
VPAVTSGTRARRQHIIPRFLINAFSSRSKGKAQHAYLFRRGAPGRECNTRTLLTERLFYGEPNETGVEALLQLDEDRFAPTHRTVLATGRLSEGELHVLLDFVGHLAVRGVHFRCGVAEAASEASQEMRRVLTSDQTARFIADSVLPNRLFGETAFAPACCGFPISRRTPRTACASCGGTRRCSKVLMCPQAWFSTWLAMPSMGS